MESIIEAKLILKNEKMLRILAESVYDPTEERLKNRANDYIANHTTAVFAYKSNDIYKGIIILDISNIKEIIILDIAISNNFKNTGIGSILINHCIKTFEPNIIVAETDDEAVEFYRKFGFDIFVLGDKYSSGITRYKCIFNCKL